MRDVLMVAMILPVNFILTFSTKIRLTSAKHNFFYNFDPSEAVFLVVCDPSMNEL
jgi:hypothetical protein